MMGLKAAKRLHLAAKVLFPDSLPPYGVREPHRYKNLYPTELLLGDVPTSGKSSLCILSKLSRAEEVAWIVGLSLEQKSHPQTRTCNQKARRVNSLTECSEYLIRFKQVRWLELSGDAVHQMSYGLTKLMR